MINRSSIEVSDKLYRWLHPGQFKWDEMRPTSAAFKDQYMSVDIGRLTSLDKSYERAQKIGKNAVASILGEQVFQKGQKAIHCPTQILPSDLKNSICQDEKNCPAFNADVDEKKLTCINEAHGCVIGKKTSSIAKFFSKNCVIEIHPEENA
jgi:hypothetical protein